MCNHLVHLFDGDFPAEAAGDFIAAGLLDGDACVVILRAAQRASVERHLHATGLDVGLSPYHSVSYIPIDTDEALLQLVENGRLDIDRTSETLRSVLGQAAQGGARRVRLVGDPAPALYAAGNKADAFALERLVDEISRACPVSVFCAYPIRLFCGEGSLISLFKICGEHSAVVFPDGLWLNTSARYRFCDPGWQ